MTLYIKVTDVDKLPKSGIMFVEGSRAGLLASQQISTNQKFNPPFLIKAAADDVLSFKIAKNVQSYQTGEILAQGVLHGAVLTKRYGNELAGYIPATNNSNINNRTSQSQQDSNIRNSSINSGSLQYEIDLYDPSEKSAGVINALITLDKVSHFEGELANGAQKQALKQTQKVALFKGKCPSKNLFSMFDPACEGQERKFIESIYKDGEDEYVL